MSTNGRVLRIHITNGEKTKVNLTVPLGLAKLARLGGVAGKLAAQQGVDLEAILDGIEESPDGTLVDVDDAKSGDHVEISLETRGVAPVAS